jgi:putative endonuclease
VTNRRQLVGRWGETLAAGYLEQRGYEILERNARTPYGEIDLVARDGDILVFVEVKTRTNRSYGMPEDSVNLRKQSHMLAAAEHYAAEKGAENWQVDVISIEGHPGEEPDIVHFENVLSQ